MLRYKIGDVVKIKDNVSEKELKSKTVIITEITKWASDEVYATYLSGNLDVRYCFTDEMIESKIGHKETYDEFDERCCCTGIVPKRLKIVKVSHVNYDLTPRTQVFYFKTWDDVKTNDYVYCDTCNGLMLCVVEEIYNQLEDVINLHDLPCLKNIKYCRLDFLNVDFEEKKESELPF